jgi:TonB family protein
MDGRNQITSNHKILRLRYPALEKTRGSLLRSGCFRLGKLGREGNQDRTVVVDILIGTDGRVRKSKVTQTTGSRLDASAEQSVLRWRFKPSLCDGVPIETTVRTEMEFRIY